MVVYRQGEILIFKADEGIDERIFNPKKRVKDNVIREGEVSGHKHEVKNGQLYQEKDMMYLEAEKGCQIIHPEHEAINVPSGKYSIKIQREYDETKHSKKVKD